MQEKENRGLAYLCSCISTKKNPNSAIRKRMVLGRGDKRADHSLIMKSFGNNLDVNDWLFSHGKGYSLRERNLASPLIFGHRANLGEKSCLLLYDE